MASVIPAFNMLKKLRKANITRAKEWNQGTKAPISFAFMELAGEVGEACNAGKKLARQEMGWKGGETDLTNLIEELADVVICVDLVAMEYNIDLSKAIRDKFNKTSKKHGFKTMLK